MLELNSMIDNVEHELNELKLDDFIPTINLLIPLKKDS